MKCILCESQELSIFFKRNDPHLGDREYVKCVCCELVFLLPKYFLTKSEEKSRYDLHENTPNDDRYINFLQRLTDPLLKKIKKGSVGLDYGCGPGPAISTILEAHGMSVKDFDPVYFDDQSLLNDKYDFITCSEVAEHFYNPRVEFLRLSSILKDKGGYLAVMTQFRREENDFSAWWYQREPTHVSFYHKRTFLWISRFLGLDVEFPENNIVIFSK